MICCSLSRILFLQKSLSALHGIWAACMYFRDGGVGGWMESMDRRTMLWVDGNAASYGLVFGRPAEFTSVVDMASGIGQRMGRR